MQNGLYFLNQGIRFASGRCEVMDMYTLHVYFKNIFLHIVCHPLYENT